MKPLAVGAVAHDDGVISIVVGPVDVATQHHAVVHLDGNVPVDAHSVSCLALVLAHVSPFREEGGSPSVMYSGDEENITERGCGVQTGG